MDPSDAIAQIEVVLAEHEKVRSRAMFDDLSDREEELGVLVVRLQAAVDRLTLPTSTHAEEARQHANMTNAWRVKGLVGILRALKADLEAGWLATVAELLHADTFDDFLTMADELLSKGYKDPAAVLAGSVLEGHLRLLCAKSGVAPVSPAGAPKKADVMNADLVKAGAYNQLQQKQVTADLAVRNASAHGNYGAYTADRVTALITNVRQLVLHHPA